MEDAADRPQALAAAAQAAGASLIVAAVPDAGGALAPMEIEQLLAQAARPVLLVCAKPEGMYARALVAVDFSAASAAAIHATQSLAPSASVEGVHVGPAERPLVQGWLKRARGQDPRRQMRLETRAGDPADALRGAARDRDVDLLALGVGGGLGAIGSVTAALAAEPPCDLLVAAPIA